MRPHEEQGWWSKNWGWFVPLTCLGCLVLPAACVGGCVWLSVSAVKQGMVGPFEEALEAARAHPTVIEALGEPIEMDWMGFQGNVSTNNDEKRSEVTFSVKGPRGRGRMKIDAYEEDGQWFYDVLEVKIDGLADPIDLRDHVPRMGQAA